MTLQDGIHQNSFAFVDWLRGLAAILVVIFHVQLHVVVGYPKNPVPTDSFTYYAILGAFDLGKYAVAVFFLISGFLIPQTLRTSSATVVHFVVTRFFRLYPAYWISLVVYVSLAVFSPTFPLWGTPFETAQALANITMLQKFFGIPDVIGAYWTLQIELIFYSLTAVLFALNTLDRQRSVMWACLACALACAIVRRSTGLGLPLAVFLALSLMFLGDMYRAAATRTDLKGTVGSSTIGCTALVIAVCMIGYGELGIRYSISYVAAIVTFGFAHRSSAHISSSRVLSRIGKFIADASYSLYLLHGSIGLAVAHSLHAGGMHPALTALCTLLVCLPVSFGVYLMVEAPAIQYGRVLAKKYSPKRLRT